MKRKIGNYWLICSDGSSSISQVEDDGKTISIKWIKHNADASKLFETFDSVSKINEFLEYIANEGVLI